MDLIKSVLMIFIKLALICQFSSAYEEFVTLHVASVDGHKSFASYKPQKVDPREELLLERLKQDEARLKSIYERIERATKQQSHKERTLLSAQVSSGLSLGSGEYFVRLGIGTPSSLYYLEVDTGSDVTWLQCAPCTSCYSQVDPIYDPRNSSSYREVYCGSVLCQTLEFSGCQGIGCSYQVVYGDRSSTSGDLAMEAFSMDTMVMRNIAFGCGHSNTGLFQGQAGLIGMGGGTLSFISQVGPSVGNVFSYCLVNRDSPVQTTAPLIFGSGAVPFSASFTPLLRNPRINTFYYAMLTGISVGGSLLPIPASVFQFSPNGTGGVILDSGTSVTRLVASAYSTLRDAYRAASRNLPGSNILIPVDRSGTFCLAFAPSSMPISVIGNIQQQTFRIGYDLQRSLISITRQQC